MRRCHLLIVFFLFCLLRPYPVFADVRAIIAEKELDVTLFPDGSAEVREQDDFAINGSVNNLVMEIRKPEKGDAVLHSVVSRGYRGDIACRPLESGEWHPNVFAGTYSLYDSPERLLIKAYYTFGTYRSQVVLRYRLSGVATRYSDVASLSLTPVSREWPTGIGRLRVLITLPEGIDPDQVDVLLRGVFVGSTEMLDERTVLVDIPDTVSGEEPVIQVLFPAVALEKAPVSEANVTRAQLQETHQQLFDASLEPILRARERAAALAGQRALAQILHQRVTRAAAIGTLLAALAGMLLLGVLHRRLGRPRGLPSGGRELALLGEHPWMARMMTNGGTFDATALLALLLQAVAEGWLSLAVDDKRGTRRYGFARGQRQSGCDVPMMARLLAWHDCVSDDSGHFFPHNPGRGVGICASEAARLAWRQLQQQAGDFFSQSGLNAAVHERLRRRTLTAGLLFFGIGLIAGVALSVWQAYLMLIPGTLLVLRGIAGKDFHARGIPAPLRQEAGTNPALAVALCQVSTRAETTTATEDTATTEDTKATEEMLRLLVDSRKLCAQLRRFLPLIQEDRAMYDHTRQAETHHREKNA